MSQCSHCGAQNRAGAAFCRFCGKSLTGRRQSTGGHPGGGWLTLDQVMAHKPRQWALLGSFLALIGSFAPWSSESVAVLGVTLGSTITEAPQAMLIAMGALAAGVFVFLTTGGRTLMVIGGVIVASVVMFGLNAMGSNPAIGLLLTGVGGGGIMYGGYRTRT